MILPDPQSVLAALASLGAVLALIVVGQWLLRRHLPRLTVADGRLMIRQTLALDTRRRIHLVECDGRSILLLTGSGADRWSAWLPGIGTEP
jgi:flagellar protein FliO/FliZ